MALSGTPWGSSGGKKLPGEGEGDTYNLQHTQEVYADEPTVVWRTERFCELGFSDTESERLARLRRCDWHEIKQKLDENRTTHLDVLIQFLDYGSTEDADFQHRMSKLMDHWEPENEDT